MVCGVGAMPQKQLSFILRHHHTLTYSLQNPQVKILMIFTNFGALKALVLGVGALKAFIFASLWTTPRTSLLQQE